MTLTRHNNPPRNSATELIGMNLDLPTLGPIYPGRCNYCNGKLPEGKLKLCSETCKKAWDREMRVLGRKLAEAAVYAQVHRGNAKKRQGRRYKNALHILTAAPRDFYTRLTAASKRYGWGWYGDDLDPNKAKEA